MADSNSPLTPEKRLLHLIESGGSTEGSASPAPAPKVTPSANVRLAGMPGVDPMGGLFHAVQHPGEWFAGMRARFGLRTLNKTAQITLVLMLLMTVANVFYEWKSADRDPLAGLDVPKPRVASIDDQDPGFDASKLQSVDSRNVFLPFAKREEVRAETAATGNASTKLVEMTKMLKLTGISYNPDLPDTNYCMIEDLTKNITIFLRPGDRIAGMKVNKIGDESVELEYEGNKIDLR